MCVLFSTQKINGVGIAILSFILDTWWFWIFWYQAIVWSCLIQNLNRQVIENLKITVCMMEWMFACEGMLGKKGREPGTGSIPVTQFYSETTSFWNVCISIVLHETYFLFDSAVSKESLEMQCLYRVQRQKSLNLNLKLLFSRSAECWAAKACSSEYFLQQQLILVPLLYTAVLF